MIIPNIPHQSHPVINPDGTMHDVWHRFFSQTTEALQGGVAQEGFSPSSQNETNINILNTPKSIGRIIYDNTNSAMKINNEGTYKELYTRPEQMTTTQIASILPSKINGTWVTNTDNSKLLYGINGVFKEVAYT